MRRREVIGVLGGLALVRPAVGQTRNVPLVGFLNAASPDTYRFNADSFRKGLRQAGFIEGQNVRIEERWANGDYNALPRLAVDLVSKGDLNTAKALGLDVPPTLLARADEVIE